MVQTLEKKTDFKKKKEKKKKRLSKEDETKEECYRFADAWVVWEEEWKELKKKNEMTFMTLGRGRKEVSRKVLPLQCHHMPFYSQNCHYIIL